MTLESTITKNRYIGNGATTQFPFTFKVWKTDQVAVITGDGNTEHDVSAQCTVSITTSGGTVTFPTAPSSGTVIVIRRSMPYTQEDDYRNGSRFNSEEIEDRFDQDCAERQDLCLDISLAVKVPITSEKTPEEYMTDFWGAWNDVHEDTARVAEWLREIGTDIGTNTYIVADESTASRTLGQRFADIVNVKDYGAKGDGIRNDTAAITAAALTGKALFFPDGLYKVDESFNPDFYMFGDGKLNYSFNNIGGCIVKHTPERENLLCTPQTFQIDKQNHYYAFVKDQDENYQFHCYNTAYCTGYDITDATVFDKNTLIGSCHAKNPIEWSLNTVVGHGMLTYSEYSTRNTLVGSESCPWLGITTKQKLRDRWHPYWHFCDPDDEDWGNTDIGNELETLYPGIGESISNIQLSSSRDENAGNCTLGRDTFTQCVKGGFNVAVGYGAGALLYNGDSNTFLGASTGKYGVLCSSCVAVGRAAGYYLHNAYGAVCIGNNSGQNTKNTTHCVFIGSNSGINYTPPDNSINRLIWIGGNSTDIPVYSGCMNSAGIYVLPEEIRARFHIKGEKSGSSLTLTSGAHLLVEGKNYCGVVIESKQGGQGFVAFANPSSNYSGAIQYDHDLGTVSFTQLGNLTCHIGSDGDIFSSYSTANLGRSSHPWDNIYVQTGPWTQSDERIKDNIEEPSEALMRAWGKVSFKIFQFKNALKEKGALARLHVGVVAQDVQKAFSSEGLEAERFGLFCYDEWDDEFKKNFVIDEEARFDSDGAMVSEEKSHIEYSKTKNAGNIYGIRYEEALALECSFLRWKIKNLEDIVYKQLEVAWNSTSN